jgi:sulfur transfer protein SufE
MTSIVEKINFFKENLELFDDDMDKYKYLLDQAKNAKKFPEEFRQESFKVDGCQAQVWLVPLLKKKNYIFTLIQMHLFLKEWSQFYAKFMEVENLMK